MLQWLQLEILDIGRFWHTPRNKKANDPHAGERLLERGRRGAEMRARRKHVVEQSDHLGIGVAERVVDRVIRQDLVRRGRAEGRVRAGRAEDRRGCRAAS